MLPLSILDLAPVSEGATPAIALHNARDLAQHAERLGYRRYWVAEHHNMVGIGQHLNHSRGCWRHHAAKPFTNAHC
jgi:alkanesulfonate monooxygenase SsuD/methylene tetrahydromethanopterin reductase-like flavin-dependent oxidoreductase (luciferase family)